MKQIWKLVFLFLFSLIILMSSRPFWKQFKTFAEVQSESHLESRTLSSFSQSPAQPLTHSIEACDDFYKLVCHKKGEISDPTGSVRSDVEGERAVLQIYRDIIQKHRDWEMEKVDQTLVEQVYTKKQKSRIESAYHWVQHTLEKWIDRQSDRVLTPQEKHLLKSRIRKTKLQLPSPSSMYTDEPDLLTKNEAYYERTQDGELRLRIGGAYVYIAKSWFNIVGTLAHELAHAIDPCELKAAQLTIPAYQRLTACFFKTGWLALRKDRIECGANDQLSEIFSDWVAAEVLAEALKLYGTEFHGQQLINAARNSVRDLCDPEDESTELDLEFHPSSHIRIQKVFGEHPRVQGILGCSPKAETFTYCTFENTLPSSTGANL